MHLFFSIINIHASCILNQALHLKQQKIANKELHGFSNPLLFLAESSANVCNFESQQRGATLEIRAKCWQSANRPPESVSRSVLLKKKSARFC